MPALESQTVLDALREALGACEGLRLGVAPDQVRFEHRLVEDLGVDSVALLDLAIGLEARLGRAVDEAALARLGTVGAMVRHLAGQGL